MSQKQSIFFTAHMDIPSDQFWCHSWWAQHGNWQVDMTWVRSCFGFVFQEFGLSILDWGWPWDQSISINQNRDIHSPFILLMPELLLHKRVVQKTTVNNGRKDQTTGCPSIQISHVSMKSWKTTSFFWHVQALHPTPTINTPQAFPHLQAGETAKKETTTAKMYVKRSQIHTPSSNKSSLPFTYIYQLRKIIHIPYIFRWFCCCFTCG